MDYRSVRERILTQACPAILGVLGGRLFSVCLKQVRYSVIALGGSWGISTIQVSANEISGSIRDLLKFNGSEPLILLADPESPEAAAQEPRKKERFFRASESLRLDSSVHMGGGTDEGGKFQALLDKAAEGPITILLDGALLTSRTLVARGSTTILCASPDCGVFKAANSRGHILTNRLNGARIVDDLIRIRGGTWNGNEANQVSRQEDNAPGQVGMGAGQSWMWKTGMWFAGVREIDLEGVTIRNAKTFALVLGGMIDKTRIINYTAFWERAEKEGAGLTTPQNWDGIHFWGNHKETYINGFWGNGDDDQLAFNTNENYDWMDPRRTDPTGSSNTGHLGNIVAENIHFENAANGVRFVQYGAENASVNHVILRNVTGRLRFRDMFWDGVIGANKIEIDGWHVSGNNSINIRRAREVVLNNVVEGAPVVVYADRWSGNYFKSRPIVVVDDQELRQVRVPDGSRILDLSSGLAYSAHGTRLGRLSGRAERKSPIAFWKMDELAGIRRAEGGLYPLISIGTVRGEPSVFGNGTRITGHGSGLLGSCPDFQAMKNWTVCGWFKWDGENTNPQPAVDGAHPIFAIYDGKTPFAALYAISMTGPACYRVRGFMNGKNLDIFSEQELLRTGFQIRPNEWAFVALRYRDGNLNVRANFKSVDTAVSQPGVKEKLSLAFGLWLHDKEQTGGGLYDDWTLWDIALTDQELDGLARAVSNVR